MPAEYQTEKSRFDREFKYKKFLQNLVKDSIEWTSKDKLIFHCHIINNDANAVTALAASMLSLVYQYTNGNGEEKSQKRKEEWGATEDEVMEEEE